ncbi:MAG: GGDEF domain-containing protein [Actinomycetota bacterium]
MPSFRSSDQLLVAIGGLLLVAAAIAPSVSGEGTVAGSLVVVGAVALGALARAARRATGRDRLTWSLALGAAGVAAAASVALRVEALSTVGIGLVCLIAAGAWAATIAMRGSSWSGPTLLRALLDGVWVLAATAPAWWTWIVQPVLEDRELLGHGPTTMLAAASILSIVVIADLAASGWRLHSEAACSFLALGAGAVLSVFAARLLVVAPTSSTAAFAAAAVVITIATERPDLSRDAAADEGTVARTFWLLTGLPLLLAAPASLTGAELPSWWALTALGVLMLRCGLIIQSEERRIEQLGVHRLLDPQTGLANRRAVADLDIEHEALGVCSIAVAGIQRLIAEHGRKIGDEVVETVAQRLSTSVRHRDVVVRLGDNEFGLILVGAESNAVVDAVAKRALARISEPITVGERRIILPASIGATFDPHGGSVSELIGRADDALASAKGRGPRTVVHA